jgi:MFS transporter, DHA1 family, inner membrane transport protein
VVFAQTVFTRAVDPVIPMIAEDLAIDVKTAALLSSAYTFPYALVQPHWASPAISSARLG